MNFEYFEHGADVGVRGIGATPEEAFEGAACALCALVAEDLSRVRPSLREEIACAAEGIEELLVAFLNELIFAMAVRRMVFGRFSVAIDREGEGRYRLRTEAWGEPIDPARHESTVEPKGATFTELKVAREGEGWIAQCVVDV